MSRHDGKLILSAQLFGRLADEASPVSNPESSFQLDTFLNDCLPDVGLVLGRFLNIDALQRPPSPPESPKVSECVALISLSPVGLVCVFTSLYMIPIVDDNSTSSRKIHDAISPFSQIPDDLDELMNLSSLTCDGCLGCTSHPFCVVC